MQAFQLSPAQTSKIIVGVIVEELGARFKRYIDFLTAATWSEAAEFGVGGMGLSAEECAACARAVEAFFGMDEASLGGATVDAWPRLIGEALQRSLLRFRFKPAGRADESPLSEHAAADIFRDAAAAANLLHGRRRIVSLVAPQGLIGFVATVLAPNLLRIPSEDARGRTLEQMREFLSFGDAVVATPTIWRYLIGEGLRAPDNSIGVVFGEAFSAELGSDMRKSGFGALRELYGSTECGLVAWRDTISEPFTLFDHWRRDGDNLARTAVSGPVPRASMDALEWIDDISFRLGPRRDGAVQIGAVNVFPDRIAGIISRHPEVASCVIASARQSNGANSLVARIRLRSGQSPGERVARDIDKWCRTQLRPQERPRIYNYDGAES